MYTCWVGASTPSKSMVICQRLETIWQERVKIKYIWNICTCERIGAGHTDRRPYFGLQAARNLGSVVERSFLNSDD
jgi:hypothetical protein